MGVATYPQSHRLPLAAKVRRCVGVNSVAHLLSAASHRCEYLLMSTGCISCSNVQMVAKPVSFCSAEWVQTTMGRTCGEANEIKNDSNLMNGARNRAESLGACLSSAKHWYWQSSASLQVEGSRLSLRRRKVVFVGQPSGAIGKGWGVSNHHSLGSNVPTCWPVGLSMVHDWVVCRQSGVPHTSTGRIKCSLRNEVAYLAGWWRWVGGLAERRRHRRRCCRRHRHWWRRLLQWWVQSWR